MNRWRVPQGLLVSTAGMLALTALLSLPPVSQQASARSPGAFPSSEVPYDGNYNPQVHGGPFFLSQGYPDQPFFGNYRGDWMRIDYHNQPAKYADALLRYCLEGNAQVGFQGQDNPVRKWYHAPYMHVGEKRREYIHGLTYELPSKLGDLVPDHPTPNVRVQNWAVSMYNAPGGYAIGRFWEGEMPSRRPVRFERGTVAFKLLFTEATPDQMPYLRGAPTVWASIYTKPIEQNAPLPPRAIKLLYLLQIDIAVRDPHAETRDGSGWVFLSYQYSSAAPRRPVTGMPPWFSNMRPLGLMWGNDFQESSPNGTLRSTILFDDRYLPPHHKRYGWGGRLNGPVDNRNSSCLSCHATSQIPHIDQAFPASGITPGSAQWMQWFRTLPAGRPYTPNGISLDYSLQLAKGVRNYDRVHPTQTPTPPPPKEKWHYDIDRGL